MLRETWNFIIFQNNRVNSQICLSKIIVTYMLSNVLAKVLLIFNENVMIFHIYFVCNRLIMLWIWYVTFCGFCQ